jgi:hypothetical protein
MNARDFWESPALARARVSIVLLLERRIGLVLMVDALFLFFALFMALTGSGRAVDFYPALVVLPTLVLGVPVLAETVAVERRAGTLDLALSSPGASFYFQRRVGAFAVLLIVQDWLAILFTRLLAEPFPLSGPLLQSVSLTFFVAAVVLNWSARFRNPGAVMFATYATVMAFAPWVFSNPIHPPALFRGPMTALDIVNWGKQNVVLLIGGAVFLMYALRRLSVPEKVIS